MAASSRSRSGGRKYGKAAGKSVKSAMHREKRGTLKSGKGWERWHGEEPQTSHRHRSFRSAQKRCQSSKKIQLAISNDISTASQAA